MFLFGERYPAERSERLYVYRALQKVVSLLPMSRTLGERSLCVRCWRLAPDSYEQLSVCQQVPCLDSANDTTLPGGVAL